MSKQTRTTSASPAPRAAATSSTPSDPAAAYSDPMALQGAPGGGNAAAAAALAKGPAADAEACGGLGLVGSEGQRFAIAGALDDIYEKQLEGLGAFEAIANGTDASFSEALAVDVAEEIVSTAITDVAMLALSASAAASGVGAMLGGAILAGAETARDKVAGELASRVVDLTADPSADWVKPFVAAQRAALFEGKRASRTLWIAKTEGVDPEQLCGINEGLDRVVGAAAGVQYRRSVAGWARYCGQKAAEGIDGGNDQQNEGFAREYELRVDVSMDAADPRKVTVVGGAIPGLAPELLRQPHMAGVTVGNSGFATRVVFAGGEILAGAGGRVLSVRTDSAEAREQLRRLGSADEKSAAPISWKATTGALGDENADLQVQNGAQKLVSLHVAPKTLASLGVAAPETK
jgi:hypothetical protein